MGLENIYGHERLKSYFVKIISENRLSHSYIFNGIEGIGKKTLSKALAKLIFCNEDSKDFCDKCSKCQKINHKNHPDFLLIDTEERSIKNKEIKSFQKFLSLLPNESDYKIVVINDSHKMTTSAQNSILKILEEPPEYALIFLITHQKNKLLDTIHSRCQMINFNPLENKILEKFLLDSYEINKNEANALSIFSNGSMKQVSLAYENEDFLNLRKEVMEISINILLNQNVKSIKKIDFLIKNKKDHILILDFMISFFRDILIVQKTQKYELIINKDQKEIIEKNIYKIIDKDISKIIKLIIKTKNDIENNVNYKLAIDYLILNMINIGGE